MRLLPLALCLLTGIPAHAGFWDRDRPDDAHLEDMVRNIGGRFDQPTKDFYEARYQRLKPLLATTQPPQSLPLYDDAAVALLRLGNFTDAIILLDRKTVQAKTLTAAEAARAERTTLANKAACLLARYTAADGNDRRDLQQALQLLDRLLQKDPYDTDAEFARREVQWLLSAPEFSDVRGGMFPNLLGITRDDLRVRRDAGALAQIGLAGAHIHLARRIVHGGGWSNPDLLYALSLALWVEGRDEEAITAWLRVHELVIGGSKSIVRHTLEPEVLAHQLRVHFGEIADLDTQQKLFREVRQAADQWVRERNEYAAGRIKAGRHPDTDPTFWHAFGETPIPRAGDEPPVTAEPPVSTTFVVGGVSALAVLLFVLGGFALFVGRRHPKAPTVDEV
jgi:tetratricopeptide (TPR) repeat protein